MLQDADNVHKYQSAFISNANMHIVETRPHRIGIGISNAYQPAAHDRRTNSVSSHSVPSIREHVSARAKNNNAHAMHAKLSGVGKTINNNVHATHSAPSCSIRDNKCGTFIDKGSSWVVAYATLSLLVIHAIIAAFAHINRANLWTACNAALPLLAREVAVSGRSSAWTSIVLIGCVDIMLIVVDIIQLFKVGINHRFLTGDPNVYALGIRVTTITIIMAVCILVAGRTWNSGKNGSM